MKNKFKNHRNIFRSLLYFLSFFLQSCTEYGENYKVVAQEHCHIAKTLSTDHYSSGEEWNIIKVPYKYHYSKHPKEYHEFVLARLHEIDGIAKGNKELFLELFNKEIRDKVLTNPNILNKTGW